MIKDYFGKPCDGFFDKTRCFVLDMDGTVYLDESWLPGAREFLSAVKTSGRNYCFFTNNCSKSADAYVEKLRRMGLEIDPKTQLISSAHATIHYLKAKFRGKKVFLLGNDDTKREFSAGGISLEEDDPDVVVAAFDTSLDYKKLCRVCDLVRSGLPYIATHPDKNCPTLTGYIPDVGALIAYIEVSSGRLPDEIIGKPNRGMADYMLGYTGLKPCELAVVGDRIYTDVACGYKNGIPSVLVLSGETRAKDIPQSDIKPDLVFDSVADMIPLL